MTYPRKANGEIDCDAFNSLNISAKREAFADLKANGTIEEKRAHQAYIQQLKEANNERVAEINQTVSVLEKQKDALLIQRQTIINESVNKLDDQLTSKPKRKKLFGVF